MKTFQIKVLSGSNNEVVEIMLKDLAKQGVIEFIEDAASTKSVSATEDQIDEIIDESEIGPYYTEEEAKKILNL